MLKKISKIPFSGTPEQEEKLHAVIAECNGDKSLLMHVMQEAQLIYGYLPFEVQAMIAEGMDVPLEKVYGVSTFYAQFALSPKGQIQYLRMSRNRLLCQRLAGYPRQDKRETRHRPRRVQ